jgi:hypothetical protein
MLSALRKNKLLLGILFTIILTAASISAWYEYGKDSRQRNLLGGILFGIFAIIKLVDVINHYRKKQRLPETERN